MFAVLPVLEVVLLQRIPLLAVGDEVHLPECAAPQVRDDLVLIFLLALVQVLLALVQAPVLLAAIKGK